MKWFNVLLALIGTLASIACLALLFAQDSPKWVFFVLTTLYGISRIIDAWNEITV